MHWQDVEQALKWAEHASEGLHEIASAIRDNTEVIRELNETIRKVHRLE